jgi:hypothetical protein
MVRGGHEQELRANYEIKRMARNQWLIPVIQLLRRQRSGGSCFKASLGK